MSSISDYYRRQAASPEAAPPEPMPPREPGGPHRAGAFALALPEGWRDHTLHVFAGPLEDEVQHTVTVATDRELEVGGLDAYADLQIKALEAQLKAFTVLKREPVVLPSGLPAVRAVFNWYPAEGRQVVQEQLYVLAGRTGYRLTATFSPATFETRGAEVRALLLSFEPAA
jgi:hypothetical protein